MKLKLACSAILIFFFLSISNIFSQTLHSEKLSLRESSIVFNDSNRVTLHEKSPLLAGALSFISPGLAFGQLYNKQPMKFLTHTCITIGCILGVSIGLDHFVFDVGGGSSGSSSGIWLILLSGAVFVANWTYSVVDAVISANEINEHAALKKSHSEIMNRIKLGLAVNKNKQLNLKFAFEL